MLSRPLALFSILALAVAVALALAILLLRKARRRGRGGGLKLDFRAAKTREGRKNTDLSAS